MSDYHINLFYSDEDGGYIADIPDLEACSAFGSTAEEAFRELEKATEGWLAAARQLGIAGRQHDRQLRPGCTDLRGQLHAGHAGRGTRVGHVDWNPGHGAGQRPVGHVHGHALAEAGWNSFSITSP